MSSKYTLTVLKDASCKHGLERSSTCDQLESELSQSGLPALQACSACNMPKSLEIMSIFDKNMAVSALQKLGLWQTARAKVGDVKCKVHGEPIITDCALRDCSFYTTYPGVRNCILVYMSKHKVDTLSTLELSMILGTPHKQITEDTNKALLFLRQESVDTTSGYEIDSRFVTLLNFSVCSVCEQPLTEAPIEDHGYKYCSISCSISKPVHVLSLESSCGVEITEVLNWAIRKYNTQGNLEEALGLSSKLLNGLLQEHLHFGLSDLFPEEVPDNSLALTKRVGKAPTWLAAFSEKTSVIQDRMIENYGPIRVDISSLQEEFNRVV
jgi:hypothetical protein